MNLKAFHIIFFTCLFQFICNAQNDSILLRYQQDFGRYRQSKEQEFKKYENDREQEFQRFKSRNDSLFYEYLNRKWKEYKVYYYEEPKVPKSVIQPEVSEEEILNHRGKEIFPVIEDQEDSIFEPEEINVNSSRLIPNIDRHLMKPVNISFYSNNDSLFFRPDTISLDLKPSEENIKKFYKYAESSQDYDDIISQLINIRAKYHLNDWGFIQVAQNASIQVFSNLNLQVLFAWYVLMQSGFAAKTGYSGNNIYLLISTYQKLTNVIIADVDKIPFYVVNFPGQKNPGNIIVLHDGVFPRTKKINMKIKELPDLNNQQFTHELIFEGRKYSVNLNSALIDFLNNYPSCSLEVYFNTPLSPQAVKSLDTFFNPLLDGMPERRKVSILLKFVQETFQYEQDEKQFKGEKYMFPDEVLKYDFSDCEDRAVFFARLVKIYTKLNIVGLDFQDHVTTAINLKEVPNSVFFQDRGEKYIVCDPTYKRACIGLLPDEFYKRNIEPKIIHVN